MATPSPCRPRRSTNCPGCREDKTADIEEAKKLLADAGYRTASRLDMIAWCSHVTDKVALAFQDWLKRLLNIDAKLRPLERAQLVEEEQAGDFDCSLYF